MRGDDVFFFIEKTFLGRLLRCLVDVRYKSLNSRPTGLKQLFIGLSLG